MGRIAVSISHEAEYAVAVAFGVRTAGGRYVFPLDIDDRLDDRERKLLARFERMQEIHQATQALAAAERRRRGRRTRSTSVADKRSVGFGRPAADEAPVPDATCASSDAPPELDDESMSRLVPERDKRGHKGSFGRVLVLAGSLDYAGAALLVCRAAGRAGAGLVTLAVPESLQPLFAAKVVEATTMPCRRTTSRRWTRSPRWPRCWTTSTTRWSSGPGCGRRWPSAELLRLILTAPDEAGRPPAVLDAEALRTLAAVDEWWTRVTRPCVLTPHAGEFARLRAGSGHAAEEDGDLSADDAARARAAASRRRGVAPGRRAQGRQDGRSPPRTARWPWRRSRTRRWRPAARATCCPGRSARCSPRAWRRTTRRVSGVYLHGLAGEAVRDRIGDAGLLAGDLPEALPIGRKRLARIAERQKTGRRLGFGVRDEGSDVAAADAADAGRQDADGAPPDAGTPAG